MKCLLKNIPDISDIRSMIRIIQKCNVKVQFLNGCMEIDAEHIRAEHIPEAMMKETRAGFYVIAPLLARKGQADLPMPGGCSIGGRPLALHIEGLQAMGAHVVVSDNVIHAAIPPNKLHGANIDLTYPSVGATVTILMAAILAKGHTQINNAAREPEIVDLAEFCNAMGARITGAGTSNICIYGVSQLKPVEYSVIPDRIEAGTFLLAAAITQSQVSISPVIPSHLTAVLEKLKQMGIMIVIEDTHCIKVLPCSVPYKAVDIETAPFPGFPTDLQAPFMALLATSVGQCTVTETVFENRLGHVTELCKLGAQITVHGNKAFITGVQQLYGNHVVAGDLRAAAALVLAGLAAEGVTRMHGLKHLLRGYDDFKGKLDNVGATMKYIESGLVSNGVQPGCAVG